MCQGHDSEKHTRTTEMLIACYRLKTDLEKLGLDDLSVIVPNRDEIITEMQRKCENTACWCHTLKQENQ